jgi:hypothetical protein
MEHAEGCLQSTNKNLMRYQEYNSGECICDVADTLRCSPLHKQCKSHGTNAHKSVDCTSKVSVMERMLIKVLTVQARRVFSPKIIFDFTKRFDSGHSVHLCRFSIPGLFAMVCGIVPNAHPGLTRRLKYAVLELTAKAFY